MPEYRVYPREISIIPAESTSIIEQKKDKKKIRVAAYCRVSTDEDEQETSFQTQIITYTNLIESKDEWELAGIYPDDGISGTSLNHRDEFKRMMQDAMDGKIDQIITKSISRFARNTVDTLTSIKLLREKNIDVYFEKERIHTLNSEQGELLLTILAGFAQEESRSISENVKWGKRKQMKLGIVHMPSNLYGYTKKDDAEFVIVENEAKVIIDFCTWYLLRHSLNEIKKMSDERGYRTRQNKPFNTEAIRRIIMNEKYAGDYLAQKTYSKDFMTKKSLINNGELPKYYIKDNHQAIISHKMRDLIIEEYNRRNQLNKEYGKMHYRQYNGKYTFSHRILCADCNSHFQRKLYIKRDGTKEYIWKCSTKNQKGGFNHCKTPNIKELALYIKLTEVFDRIENEYHRGKKYMVEFFENELQTATGYVKEIIQDTINLLNENIYGDEIERKLQSISLRMRDDGTNIQEEIIIKHNELCKIKEIVSDIHSVDLKDKESLDLLIRKRINVIKVHNSGMLEVQFFSGYISKIRYE